MKKLLLVMMAVMMLLALAVAGCGEQPAEIDNNGETGDNGAGDANGGDGEGIGEQRIVSLIPSNTEVLFALGLGEAVVGVTELCEYPPEMETAVAEGRIQRVGDAFTINEELIISLEPTLVLFGYDNEAAIEHLNSLGIETAVISPRSIREVLESVLTIGELTGRGVEAQILAGEMEESFAEIASKTAGLTEEERPRVLFILDLEFLYVAGGGTLENELIILAGGVNAIDFDDYNMVSKETIIESMPDIIVNSFPYREQILAEKEWKNLPAVQNEAIYDLDADLINQPTPRMVEGLRQLLAILHPDL